VNHISELLLRLRTAQAVLVRVLRVQGSAPRDAGAWMAVFADDMLGTVGGGHMEFSAVALARQMLQSGQTLREERFALGPSLGQCCGGVVHLRLETIGASDSERLLQELAVERVPIALFGAGHVGAALVQVFASLPFAVHWLDSRGEVFPAKLPDNVQCEHSDPVQAAVSDLVPAAAC